MSHEIRTPMNAILGFTQLLTRDTSLTAPQRQHLDTISRSGMHLLGLINDILEMSKIEAGKVILNPKTFDLHAWIHDIETMFRVRTEAKKLQFLVDIDEHLPQYITADEHKLSSIFVNLLGNAVKFTEEGGITWRIRAGIRQNGIFQLISEVEDSGAGIAPEEIQHLFKVFEQTSVGMAAGGGTGLGLAISRKIAQLMGGDILVESEPGRGSIFRVEVELKAGTKAGVRISAPIRHISHLKERQKSLRILIADDNEENRILLTHMLRSVGFQTREADNGKEAVDFASLWEPHLILMDIRMPVLNGYQAIEQIRATDFGKEIPIIAVTASAFRDEKQNILRSGANHYIRKPFKDHELFTAIEELLKVEYVYQEESSATTARPQADLPLQSPDWRKQLPEGWAAQVQQAVNTANLDHLLQLIQKIEEQAPQAANLLRDYAQTYQYDLILEFIGEK
jgi:two-component system sensor histidine kinase/response regulator